MKTHKIMDKWIPIDTFWSRHLFSLFPLSRRTRQSTPETTTKKKKRRRKRDDDDDDNDDDDDDDATDDVSSKPPKMGNFDCAKTTKRETNAR